MTIDLHNHPLTDFFLQVCAEYERGLQKYGPWENICEDLQVHAIFQEYEEIVDAYMTDDIDGEHGELAELPQLANVVGKRWNYLTARRNGQGEGR